MDPIQRARPRAFTTTLVGPAEIATLLDVKRATVDKWRQRDVLPEPDYDLAGGPVWWQSTILTWARATGRGQVGRRRPE